eukprot:813000-Prymnesium_polylepis.1
MTRGLALASLLCAASAASLGGRGGRLAVVDRLRGGAHWVKQLSNEERTLVLVHSLSKFCDEHELDEEAMLSVAAGEAADHRGWQCGALDEYDALEAQQEDAATETAEE